MARPGAVARDMERLFQISLVLLLSVGYVALLWAGRIDPVVALITLAALFVRLARALEFGEFALDRRIASALAVGFVCFFPLDLLFVSRDFIAATLRMLFLFTALKLIIARGSREYFYLGLLAFLQLLSAAMFIAGPGYLALLFLFLVLAAATYAAFEIRAGCLSGAKLAVTSASRKTLAVRLAILALALASGILALSTGLFLALPRAIGNPPLQPMRGDFAVGFSPEVDLSLTGALQSDHRPVMRVEAVEGGGLEGLYWRGSILHRFDGVRWSAPGLKTTLVSARGGGYPLRPGHQRRPDEGRRVRYRVSLEPLFAKTIFLTGLTEQISGTFAHLIATDTGLFRTIEPALQSLRYEAVSWLADRKRVRRSQVVELFSDPFRARYLQLPRVDPRLARLAIRWTAGETTPLRKAAALERRLRNDYGYTLDLPNEQHEDPLAHFLIERREGHCQYFASSMAVMLRILGVPSRIVNGFAGGVRNPISGRQVLRSSDAHSWVEAYIPGYGWLEFDPTPEDPNKIANPWIANAWMYWDALQSAWAEWVLDYDVRHQVLLAHSIERRSRQAVLGAALSFAKLRDRLDRLLLFRLPEDGLRWIPAAAVPAGMAVLLVWLAPRLGALRRRRRLTAGRGAAGDCSYFYLRAVAALERKGFRRARWQTAEEFADSLPAESARSRFRELVRIYNAARFGSDAAAARALPSVVASFEKAVA